MDGQPSERGQRLSRAAAQRLSLYLRCVAGWPADGEKVSSGRIAEAVGVSDAQVRRDLAALGHLGQRGVGYDARELGERDPHGTGHRPTVARGPGRRRQPRPRLAQIPGLPRQGFEIVGLFDSDPAKVGNEVEGLTVEPISALTERVAALQAELGVLTVPGETAHTVAEALVAAGVRGILNFAPVVLKLPRRVRLVTVDLAIQLEQLAFQVQHGDTANRTTGRGLTSSGVGPRLSACLAP